MVPMHITKQAFIMYNFVICIEIGKTESVRLIPFVEVDSRRKHVKDLVTSYYFIFYFIIYV